MLVTADAAGNVAFHLAAPTPAGLRAGLEIGRARLGTAFRRVATVAVEPVDDHTWIAIATLLNGIDNSVVIGRFDVVDGRVRLVAAGVVDRLEYRRSVATADGFEQVAIGARTFRSAQVLRWHPDRNAVGLIVELPGNFADDALDANADDQFSGGVVQCEVALRTDLVTDGDLSPTVPFQSLPATWIGAGCDARVAANGRDRWLAMRVTKDPTVLAPALQPLQILGEAPPGSWQRVSHEPLLVGAHYAVDAGEKGLRVTYVAAAGEAAQLVRAERQPSGSWRVGDPEGIHAAGDSTMVLAADRTAGRSVWQLDGDGTVRRLSR